MEIGITGGEEDGVDNSGVKAQSSIPSLDGWDKLLQNLKKYFTPFNIQVYNVYKALSPISPMFSIAAARSVQGWQCVPVPTPAEGAPGVCQSAAQV